MDVAVIVRRDGILAWCEREFSLGRIARIQLHVLEAAVRLEHDHGDPVRIDHRMRLFADLHTHHAINEIDNGNVLLM